MVPHRLFHPPQPLCIAASTIRPFLCTPPLPVSGKFWLKSMLHRPCGGLTPAPVREIECQSKNVGDVYEKPQQSYCSPLSSRGGGENHRCKFPQQRPAQLLLRDSSPFACDLQRERSRSLSHLCRMEVGSGGSSRVDVLTPGVGSDTGHPPTTSTLALLPPSWVPVILSSPHGSLGSREALGPPEAHSTTLSLTSSFPTVHWDHWRLTRKWRGGVQPGPCYC